MDNNKDFEIEEILKEYNQQKRQHIQDFGELETTDSTQPPLPEKAKKKKRAKQKKEHKSKAPKPKKKMNKQKLGAVLKRILLVLAAMAAIAGIVFGIISAVHYSKEAYLKPYREKYPDVSFPVGIEERFCDYYGQHPNTVGYIEIPDAGYSQYILSDNNYVNPVLDKANSRTELDFNTVVYITDNTVHLEKYYSTGKAYLSSNGKISYSTLYNDYEFAVIGAFYTNADPADDAGYCFPYNLTQDMTEKSLHHYTDRLEHRFLYDAGYTVTAKSKLITLCIKSDFMPNFRFIVVGMLNSEHSNQAVDNEQVHYPQVWYDKNGTQNIYRFASKWYPEILLSDSAEETSQQNENEFTKY